MSRRARLEVAALEDRCTPAHVGMIAAGSGPGVESRVEVYNNQTGAFRFAVNPFPGFTGGVTVASGDVNGDQVDDLIVGAGPGGGPSVSVFDGNDGTFIGSTYAYESTFRGGVNVSAGDFNNDGKADIVVGSGVGGGPRVRVLNGQTFAVIREALVYEATFRGGVNVAAGDVNGDGTPDIATSAGAGGGPRVVILNGKNFATLSSFFAFDSSTRTGINIALGDVNADSRADIAVGAGPGAPGEVKVFNARNLGLISDFFVSNQFGSVSRIPYISGDAGINVAVADVNGDDIGDILTAKGPGSIPVVRAYQITAVNPTTNALIPTLNEIGDLNVFNPNYGAGVSLGASS